MHYNILWLVTESLLCSLLLHITYRIWKLLVRLKSNMYIYKFGSIGWWHWIEHCGAAVLFFIGSIGMSYFSLEKLIRHIAHLDELLSSALNIFTSLSIIAGIILVNYMIKEETHGSDMHHGDTK